MQKLIGRRNVQLTAVEHNNQKCQIITLDYNFSSQLICKIKIKISQMMNKNDVKTLGVTYFASDLLRSYFHEPQKNEIY